MSRPEVVDNFLLSHHGRADRDRCLVLALPWGRFLACARCLGACLGLAAGLPALWLRPALVPPWLLFLAFPDWVAHALLGFRGSNAVRVGSGAIIGLVYALNVLELLRLRFRADLWAVNASAVGIYAAVAWWKSRLPSPRGDAGRPPLGESANVPEGRRPVALAGRHDASGGRAGGPGGPPAAR